MKKTDKLRELNQIIKNCQKCDLAKTRKNAVPGEGPLGAKIMIIGQAPGREEDITGRPFVGRAGKLLDRLLKIAEIERKKVFITSPLKCFPPKNRKPKRSEIETCLPYLKEQIKIINPRKFILLGEIAFSVFFPKLKLKDYRGKVIKVGKKEFFITYHPAAGLRFPWIKEILIKDFKKLKKLKWQN
ncbi:MAG TPA: uracil-DNA glycosylase [Candidatus Desulfofervidus auxilii]|uniref:Type-4 uracil-DNA glycosylase n=1 Tax=Desulfofervidus auxilii TaxID=1621989 RepID=A0A7V0IA08_DESA2|nr:uracil-DNA glycosylase [Candidatus Desulfofervidus auxilii]